MYGISDRISSVIRERNLTLTEIAKSARISRETISGIVNGRQMPRRSTLNAIADALGVELEFLTNAEGGESSTKSGISQGSTTYTYDVSSLLETLGMISVAVEKGIVSDDERLVCQRVIARLLGSV